MPQKKEKFVLKAHSNIDSVDRTVWNRNTMPLPGTLDPLECKNIIRHLKGTNNKILNKLHYNNFFTLLEEHSLKNV